MRLLSLSSLQASRQGSSGPLCASPFRVSCPSLPFPEGPPSPSVGESKHPQWATHPSTPGPQFGCNLSQHEVPYNTTDGNTKLFISSFLHLVGLFVFVIIFFFFFVVFAAPFSISFSPATYRGVSLRVLSFVANLGCICICSLPLPLESRPHQPLSLFASTGSSTYVVAVLRRGEPSQQPRLSLGSASAGSSRLLHFPRQPTTHLPPSTAFPSQRDAA